MCPCAQTLHKIWVKSNNPCLIYRIFAVQFLVGAQIPEQFSVVHASNFIKLADDIGPSSPLIKFVLDFNYFALFQNTRHSKASGVEKRCQISHFLTPVKSSDGWVSCLCKIIKHHLPPNLWYTFDGWPLCCCQEPSSSNYSSVYQGLLTYLCCNLGSPINSLKLTDYHKFCVLCRTKTQLVKFRLLVETLFPIFKTRLVHIITGLEACILYFDRKTSQW